jgi:small subunit ribosomal protein S14
MAKKSHFEKEKKRDVLIKKFAVKRAALKKKGDWAALSELPRNSSPVRKRNRCAITGRSRAFMRKFGLCRNMFRELALSGELPGVTKSSW